MINSYLISMHAKFMKLGMRAPYVIPDLLTKWHIPFLLILAVISYLSTAYLNFNQLFIHDLGLNFGYVTPYNISNVHKNLHKSLQ
jgi:hypothetical protein